MIEIGLRHMQGEFLLNVDLSLPAQGILGLMGASGSGKSTLFSCLAGHIRPGAGRIVLNGRILFDSPTGVCVPPARRGIGVVFQEGLLFPHLNVRDNLLYGANKPSRSAVSEVVETLELTQLLRARPRHLSGGERQRVAIGRALLAEPELLLLDEPVSALDPEMKRRTLDLIEAVQKRTATPMIYISHAPEEMRRLCGPIVTLHQGKVSGVHSAPTPQSTTERDPEGAVTSLWAKRA